MQSKYNYIKKAKLRFRRKGRQVSSPVLKHKGFPPVRLFMNFYISDLHLFSKFLLRIDNRPFESCEKMREKMIANWNKVVGKADHVYILGDIVDRYNPEAFVQFMESLNGTKHLIIGNHDSNFTAAIKKCFCEITPYKTVKDTIKYRGKEVTKTVILSHYPIMFWDGQHKGSILLYGHLHNSEEQATFTEFLKIVNERHRRKKEPKFLAYNVGCMLKYMKYTPKTLQQLMNTKTVDPGR